VIEIGIGLGLSVGIGLLSWVVWDAVAALAAAWFGILATGIHLVAVTLLKPALRGSYKMLMARWSMGMGLRLFGVAVYLVLTAWKRELVPPLPAAIGYVGVLLPLLFSEMRLLR
jgi:hypothetical protein